MTETSGQWPEVIVPVYNGDRVVRRCLEALAQRLPRGAQIQIVDDTSTCAETRQHLDQLQWPPYLQVRKYRNEHNLGFVATVNAAMGRASGDVVLLNSDTVVSTGWLEALSRCATSDPRIATITPWSNNAEICSLPKFVAAAPVPDGIDAIAEQLGHLQPTYPDLPTGVGFCMYIRRRAWQSLFGFDAATFGRGYGEENDFCLRAAAHGWRNVLCDNAYVAHVGGASFSTLGLKPGGENLARLIARYPYYNALIADYIQRDPLSALRERILAVLSSAGIELPQPDAN